VPQRCSGRTFCSDRRPSAASAMDNVIVARVFLMGFAVVTLAAALVRSAQ
jgi:hypothetical protein